MEEEIIALVLILEKRREQDNNVRRQNMAGLRDKEDPFLLEENIFRKFFRFPKSLCWDLIYELKPYDEQKSGIPFELRFISVLYFLANGSYQTAVANSYFSAMSQASVSRNIKYICKLIVRQKGKEVSFPNTMEQYNAVKMSFHRKYGIKGCIGAIDCTHIAIIAPASTTGVVPHDYMNRKGYYSINVEAICDDNLLFRHLNAWFPGSCHDSGIWTTSPARIKLIREHVAGAFKWLLGDSGYPLEPWLLTPVANPSTDSEELYNNVHIRARSTIERAFGVLKSRFRCLSRERTLRYSHTNVSFFVYTCAIFHNILQKNGIFVDESDMLSSDDAPQSAETNPAEYFAEGKKAQQSCINAMTNI